MGQSFIDEDRKETLRTIWSMQDEADMLGVDWKASGWAGEHLSILALYRGCPCEHCMEPRGECQALSTGCQLGSKQGKQCQDPKSFCSKSPGWELNTAL